jgi:hypothetical protein
MKRSCCRCPTSRRPGRRTTPGKMSSHDRKPLWRAYHFPGNPRWTRLSLRQQPAIYQTRKEEMTQDPALCVGLSSIFSLRFKLTLPP